MRYITGQKMEIKNCNIKCPCRRWLNCDYYVDEHEKQIRIQMKEKVSEIHVWYEEIFRCDITMHDLYVNG